MYSIGEFCNLLLKLCILASSHHPGLSYSYALTGQNVVLACSVTNLGNSSVGWQRVGRREKDNIVLTMGGMIVTQDDRVSVITGPGGEVTGLGIDDVVISDRGMYLCMVNTTIISHHLLSVGDHPHLGVVNSSAIHQAMGGCCSARNISTTRNYLCSRQDVFTRTMNTCKDDYSNMMDCMVGGRDHMPCCLDAGIPAACTPLCRGEHPVEGDTITSVFSCAEYSDPILSCIVQGTSKYSLASTYHVLYHTRDPTLLTTRLLCCPCHRLLHPCYLGQG